MRDKNLLLIENVSDIILFFIERFGHQNLDIAEDVDDAIDCLRNKIYNYIFIGGSLSGSGENYIEAAKYLRKHIDNPNSYATIITHNWCIADAGEIIKLLPWTKYLPFSTASFSSLDI